MLRGIFFFLICMSLFYCLWKLEALNYTDTQPYAMDACDVVAVCRDISEFSIIYSLQQ